MPSCRRAARPSSPLARSDAPQRSSITSSQYGGHVIQTSLSEDDEAHLRAALGETTTTG